MTRRAALFLGATLPVAVRNAAWAFAAREFWNTQPPSDWTATEIQELLTKSPWSREAAIHDYTQVGSLGSGRAGGGGGRHGGRATSSSGSGASSTSLSVKWQAMVRWESALPIREALRDVSRPAFADCYVLNLIGNLPGPVLDASQTEEEQRRTMDLLKDVTKLEHKGDEIGLSRVEIAPQTSPSLAGTLFHFSRELALQASDKQATFTTRIGPIGVKCQFALKDMLYRGNLEL